MIAGAGALPATPRDLEVVRGILPDCNDIIDEMVESREIVMIDEEKRELNGNTCKN